MAAPPLPPDAEESSPMKELERLLTAPKDSSSIHYDEDTIPHGQCSDPVHCDCMCPHCWDAKVSIIRRGMSTSAVSEDAEESCLDMWIGNEHTTDVLRRVARRMDVDSADALLLNTLADRLTAPAVSGEAQGSRLELLADLREIAADAENDKPLTATDWIAEVIRSAISAIEVPAPPSGESPCKHAWVVDWHRHEAIGRICVHCGVKEPLPPSGESSARENGRDES